MHLATWVHWEPQSQRQAESNTGRRALVPIRHDSHFLSFSQYHRKKRINFTSSNAFAYHKKRTEITGGSWKRLYLLGRGRSHRFLEVCARRWSASTGSIGSASVCRGRQGVSDTSENRGIHVGAGACSSSTADAVALTTACDLAQCQPDSLEILLPQGHLNTK